MYTIKVITVVVNILAAGGIEQSAPVVTYIGTLTRTNCENEVKRLYEEDLAQQIDTSKPFVYEHRRCVRRSNS